ncbi:MAG: hypothetical protein ACLGGX_02590 [Bdellovibrionia bacterium]
MIRHLCIFALVLFSSLTTWSQQPKVGREAAAKYFQGNRAPDMEEQVVDSVKAFSGSSDRVLALHFGKYTHSQAYEWGGSGKETRVGQLNGGVTYRIGEWEKSMDLNLRVDYLEFDVRGEKATKLSIMPLITFPDAAAKFPLYFGIGGGLGVFFDQVEDESPLSFDYQLILGARFFEVFENTGFFIESGMKNHLHLLTSGQLNGSFFTFGAVFTF